MNPSTRLTRITASDKVQKIISAIRSFILDGGLPPGTELPSEKDLSDRLGVNRFSLREALRALQIQGLIEIRHGRRPRVAAPSPEPAARIIGLTLKRSESSLLHLIEARLGLETQIARLAALRATRRDVDDLRATIECIEADPKNVLLCVEKDVEFHNILVSTTGNAVFDIMLAPLTELLRESRIETVKGGADRIIIGHRAILAAVAAADGEGAAEAMRRHLEMACDDIRRAAGLPSSKA